MREPFDPPRSWRSRLRPGFTDLLGVFLVLLVALMGGDRLFGDADAATHIATGQWILRNRQVPRVDPFSGTHAGAPWFAHEWLADLGMAIVHRLCGFEGLVAAAAVLIGLAHLLLFRFLVRRGDDVLAAFGAVVAAAATASSHWLARPHLLTVLFLVVSALRLEEVVHRLRPVRSLLLLPLLALLWANMHGGFLVLFGVLGCYVVGSAVVPGDRMFVRPLLLTGAGCAAAILVNPWGWLLPRHLLAFFTVHGAALGATSEFAPAAADRAGVALIVFCALSVAGVAGGWRGRATSPRPYHPSTLLALALTTVMAFTSIRHVEVMVIFGAMVISGGVSFLARRHAGPEWGALLAALRKRETGGGGAVAGASFLIVCLLACTGGLPRAGFSPASFPVEAVAALRSHGAPAGPVFTPDVWGGYLILEWPEARVFVDGRWDMYGDRFFQRYADIYLGRDGWSEGLREAGVTLAILPLDAPLVPILRSSPDWERLWEDGTAVVFRPGRTGS